MRVHPIYELFKDANNVQGREARGQKGTYTHSTQSTV